MQGSDCGHFKAVSPTLSLDRLGETTRNLKVTGLGSGFEPGNRSANHHTATFHVHHVSDHSNTDHVCPLFPVILLRPCDVMGCHV
jgi:hypothetical protein